VLRAQLVFITEVYRLPDILVLPPLLSISLLPLGKPIIVTGKVAFIIEWMDGS
jgi:hypothetical protein